MAYFRVVDSLLLIPLHAVNIMNAELKRYKSEGNENGLHGTAAVHAIAMHGVNRRTEYRWK